MADCCAHTDQGEWVHPENAGQSETPNPEKPELTFRRCLVCKRRHFEMVADTGRLGAQGAPVGGRAQKLKMVLMKPVIVVQGWTAKLAFEPTNE